MKNKHIDEKNTQNDPETWWKLNPNPWEKWDGGKIDVINKQNNQPVKIVEAKEKHSFLRQFKIQFTISCILFLIIVILGQLPNTSLQKGKEWLREALSAPFNFVAVANYYEQFFAGSPSFIPSFGNRSEQVLAKHQELTDSVSPLRNASLIQSFAQTFNGIELAGDDSGEVIAIEKGRVILVRDQQDSIIIQHANNKISIYAKLEQVFVEVGDWVEAGTIIGKLPKSSADKQSLLFFALKQNDQYIDPLEVIPIE